MVECIFTTKATAQSNGERQRFQLIHGSLAPHPRSQSLRSFGQRLDRNPSSNNLKKNVGALGTRMLAPANSYAQKNCAERFSALNVGTRREGSTSAFRNRIACPDDAGHRNVTSCKTFSTTFFVFTADVELRFDVWRLRLEVRSFFYFSKALHRQVRTGRNARNSG